MTNVSLLASRTTLYLDNGEHQRDPGQGNVSLGDFI